MTTKLTLSLSKKVIEKAKEYAKKNNRSLSEIVESYLDKVTSDEQNEGDSEIDQIRGIIKLPKNFSLKKESRKLRNY